MDPAPLVSTSQEPSLRERAGKLWSQFVEELNFFRVHVLFFTFTPLIFSGILYAANGSTQHVEYIDALFLCFSAGTVCGLTTVDLSALTGFQQAILFFQSAIGGHVVVSWVMVYIRRRYFNKRLQHIVETEIAKRKARAAERSGRPGPLRRFTNVFTMHPSLHAHSTRNTTNTAAGVNSASSSSEKTGRKQATAVRPDAIRRTSATLRRVDPNGAVVLETVPENAPLSSNSAFPSQASTLRNDVPVGENAAPMENVQNTHTVTFQDQVRAQDMNAVDSHRSEREDGATVSIRDGRLSEEGYFGARVESPVVESNYRPSVEIVHDDRTYIPPGGAPIRRRTTVWTTQRRQTMQSTRDPLDPDAGPVHDPLPPLLPATKNKGYGGFPYPTTLLYKLFKRKAVPGLRRTLTRISTLHSHRQPQQQQEARYGEYDSEKMIDRMKLPMRYFSESFSALIGRNSKFYDLTEDSLEELGGVEYRALNALLWIIAAYHLMTQLLSFTILAPYMSISRWSSAFSPPSLHKHVSPVWYSAFQVVSAYTTTGMSLVDQSIVPFQEAYPLIFVCTFLIMAGYLAYPIFLRFFIWSIKQFSAGTRLDETLHFLLDHPRRCYIYLFPSQQTWLLFAVVILFNIVDWVLFLVLNIGVDAFESIPVGVRCAIGVLQSTAARAGGFATMSISAMAPALQVAFVVMMYLGVYPIALSVQATNVYEEKSLGVFEDEEDNEEAAPEMEASKPTSVGTYLAWHARRQLSFDMWFLGLTLFLLCIIERGKIRDSDNFEWFTIFALVFEITSAYSGVGMSLGVPYANFSLSGALTPLSKFILVLVMLRGRHRGLPVAIDRAVMLPFEFKKAQAGASASGQNVEQGQGGGGAEDDEVLSVMNRIIDDEGEVRKKSSWRRWIG